MNIMLCFRVLRSFSPYLAGDGHLILGFLHILPGIHLKRILMPADIINYNRNLTEEIPFCPFKAQYKFRDNYKK